MSALTPHFFRPFLSHAISRSHTCMLRKSKEEFNAENPELRLKALTSSGGVMDMDLWSGDNITMIRGDYFALDETKAGRRFDAVFDRASLAAMSHPNVMNMSTSWGSWCSLGGRYCW